MVQPPDRIKVSGRDLQRARFIAPLKLQIQRASVSVLVYVSMKGDNSGKVFQSFHSSSPVN